jgi:uncharacterized protein YdhG (YjbR/CyaY superfamily)
MTVSEYYDQVPPAAQARLQDLRQLILAQLASAEEVIGYQIPHFVYRGKKVVAIGGWLHHVALYPLSASTLDKFSDQLKDYQTSRGAVQFSLERPLPEDLIKKIVRSRLDQLFA